AAALAVNQSRGWVVDTFTLDRVVVNGTGIYHPGCGMAARIPMGNSTLLSGRVRVAIVHQPSGIILRKE
ncbi:MAG: hypothetical protein QXU69_05315, partial [Thermofilaceae archaeon]